MQCIACENWTERIGLYIFYFFVLLILWIFHKFPFSVVCEACCWLDMNKEAESRGFFFVDQLSPERGPRPDWDKRLCEESDLVIQTPAHPSMHEATKDTDGSGIVSDERRKSTPSPTWGGWRRNWNSRYFAVCNSNLPCFPPMLSRQTTFLTIFYKFMVEQPPGSPHGHHLRHDF